MSKGSTLYRFKVSLSDIDRGVYEALDFRVAMHASESEAYLLTRVLAFILNFQDGLEFSQGLAVPDDPAIRLLGDNGGFSLWIDIGNPAVKRLHKASKACRAVRVYTYKDPESLLKEAAGEAIHRAESIEIFSFEPKFLKELGAVLVRDNDWVVIQNDGELMITSGNETWNTRLGIHRIG